jgi:exodeoxyribonuclease V gamma subunit
MLRVVYSNRTEELVAELASRVRAQQNAMGALLPVRVVTPSATVEEYLRRGIAREAGVAANLEMPFITTFAADVIGQAAKARVAGADAFEAMALTLLLDESFVAHPELAPVRAYLAAGKSRESTDVRRVQFAARVGRLFEEYAFSRAEMLDGWSRAATLEGRYAESERWQRRFWLAMFGDGGIARARGLVAISEAIRTLSPALGASSTVHVFGFAHVARAFHDLFAHLAAAGDIIVYSLSPCEGFWEDFDQRDPTLLRLWGRPGREHVRALNAASGFDHEDRFVEPSGTLLAQLQRDLLRREPARESVDARFAFESDESIVVLEHASMRRELEAVASEIWRLLERDETLCFDDIAVLVPDADVHAYLAHLTAVFREAHDIPHQLVDVAAESEGVHEAIDLLLSLPLGRFTRQELLRLAIHPSVVASLDDVDPARWLAWCDALGVVHGADRTDHEDTYIERDILNWDQGLRRLALGAFMTSDQSGERRPFELGGEAYVPQEVPASELRDAAALGVLVRSLMADARFVQGAELSLKDWAALLCSLVETYVAPANDAEAEPLARCLRRLHAIGDFDVGDRRVPYRIACELARARITLSDRRRGAEGVVVSRLASVRPIPFRVVFACGMGEGRFPSPDTEDPLDLRWACRLEGDVTARERDKYAFLEVLLGARDRLYLSYVSRDPLTGDALSSSSVVKDLLGCLARGYVRSISGLERRHPLRRWDPLYFPDLFAPGRAGQPTPRAAREPERSDVHPGLGTMRLREARAEARTLALRLSMEACGEHVDRDCMEARAALDSRWSALAEHLRIAPLPQVATAPQSRIVIPMFALVKFLEFPLQGWARFRVGLDELDDDDALAREDEPFETHIRDETLLLRGVLFASAARESLEQTYDEVVRDRELRGSGPSGVFAQGERGEHLATLEGWKERLAALDVPLDAIEVHRFGRAGEHSTADHVHPPLVVDVDLADDAGVTRIERVEISGRTLPLGGRDSPASVTLSRRTKEGRDDWERADRQRAILRAFVDHAVLTASGVAEERGHASLTVVSTPQGTIAERVSFEPMSQSEAVSWLRGLARELVGGAHAYFFPCEAVLLWKAKAPTGPVTPWLEAARERLRDSDGPLALRSAYGPVPKTQRYPVPDEATARAMVERRFGTLFAKWRSES